MGDRLFFAYICFDDEYNVERNKSYGEFVKDWNQYIDENYSQYSLDGME